MFWLILVLLLFIVIIIVIASFALPEFGEFALNLGKGFLKWSIILLIIIVVIVAFYIFENNKKQEKLRQEELRQEQIRQETFRKEKLEQVIQKQKILSGEALEECKSRCHSVTNNKEEDFLIKLRSCLDKCEDEYSPPSPRIENKNITIEEDASENANKKNIKKKDSIYKDYNHEETIDDVRSYMSNGWIQAGRGNHKTAIQYFSHAIQLNPNYASSYMLRGISYTYLKKYNEAQDDFDKAIRLKPDNPDAYYNYACMFALKKDDAQSCKLLQLAIKKGFNNWEHLKRDKDFDNIRNSDCFIDILNQSGK